jgi:parallel beta-helix repeat protein
MDQTRYHEAHQLLLDSLDISNNVKDLWGVAKCLEALGILATMLNAREHGMHFVRAASRLRQTIGAPRTSNEQDAIVRSLSLTSALELDADLVDHPDDEDLARVIAHARASADPPAAIGSDSVTDGWDASRPNGERDGERFQALTRLVVVDDDRGYRDTIRDVYLAPFRDQVTVVAEAGTCEEAMTVVREHRPDVLLFDLSLPQRAGMYRPRVQNGISIIKALKSEMPKLPILVLSHHDEEPSELIEAIRAGALGYVSKRDVVEGKQLIGPINFMMSGQRYFGPIISDLLGDFVALGQGSEPTAEQLAALVKITDTGSQATGPGQPPSERAGEGEPSDSCDSSRTRASQAITRVVAADGGGNFTTIAQAIAAAGTGDRIAVRPGRYTETLTIEKPLEIVAEGPGEVIIESDGACTIKFQAEWGRLERLTLRHLGDGSDCLEITGGTLEVRSCDLASRGRSAVAVSGGANPWLRENRIHDSRVGVWIKEQSVGLLEGNEITKNRDLGVLITSGAKPTLRLNRIRANGRGVLIAERGSGTLDENEVSHSESFGVRLNSGTNSQLTRNQISHNSGAGVVASSASGLLQGNDIHSNSLAGVIIEGGLPVLRGNYIRDNRGVGVRIGDRSRAEFVDNRILLNAAAGVELCAGSCPVIRSNRIYKNEGEGVRVQDAGAGVVERNDLRENGKGSWNLPPDGAPLLQRTDNLE